MRILHYLSDVRLEQGGTTRAVLDLCGMLAEHGHQATLLTYDGTDIPRDWPRSGSAPGKPTGMVIAPPTLPGGYFGRGALREVAETLARHDVLHVHGMWTPSNAQFCARARRAGVPYVWSTHGMLSDWSMSVRGPKKKLYMRLVGRRTLDRAAAVLFTAQDELNQARKQFSNPVARVIPLMFDLSLYQDPPGPAPARAKHGLRPERGVVLFLSRLVPVKGVDLLVRAMDLLRARGVDAELLVAGTGDEAHRGELEALTDELGLRDRVRFLGFVAGRDKVSLIEACDVFAFPSKHENFGFVWAEALTCRKPVITCKGVGVWPELEAGGGALIVERDPEGLADGIEALLKDPERRCAMGVRGRAWVAGYLDNARLAGEYERLYMDALAGAGHAAAGGGR